LTVELTTVDVAGVVEIKEEYVKTGGHFLFEGKEIIVPSGNVGTTTRHALLFLSQSH
jgi:hypothetical protein